ncbi:hypothetical protein [Streptomyces ziwulingensis]|uniref:Uncharacterized protein n=1 Tax=Streptomyces ziwulingensis TaxID=1045501 RepID=A0ABP9C283_9ACTN
MYSRFATRPAPAPFDAADAEVLRVVSDVRTPVFVTVQASGRRRYGYWRPCDPGTNRPGCYVALPTAVCDKLYAAGRLTLGEPLVDPGKTTYRVRLARTPATPTRTQAAPVHLPAQPPRAVAQALAA